MCTVNGGVLHGAPGNSLSTRRRALAMRWVGDDATFIAKREPSDQVPLIPPGPESPAELATGTLMRDAPSYFPVVRRIPARCLCAGAYRVCLTCAP